MYALVVATSHDERAVLSLVFQRVGLGSRTSGDLEESLGSLPQQPTDVIVLALDDGDPLDAIRRIRAATEVPVAMVLDRVGESTHYQLLEAGADLVVCRPFSARLLVAQVRNLLRRSRGMPMFGLPGLSLAGVALDPASRTVRVEGGQPRRLTNLEFRLLYTLMIHRDQVLPPDVIVERVWGYSGQGDRELVRGLISRLRAKVEPQPRRPRYITTVPGVGYSFQCGDS